MPRLLLRLPLPRSSSRTLIRRLLSTTPPRQSTTSQQQHPPAFPIAPSPPRLPKEEQEVFERLQRSSTGAFSTPRSSTAQATTSNSSSNTSIKAQGQTSDAEGELHPDVRRGARAEFEGERNPRTGEVGGPKNEPLRWGGQGDWSYNGRVTDF